MNQDSPDAPSPQPTTDGKRLVVVVHGVGDAAAGDTVGTLARAVAASSGRSLAPTREVLWLPEDSGRQIEVFPSYVERIRDAERETVLAEVTWEDLSRMSSGPLGTVAGLFALVFGLGNIARHAADPARESGGANPWVRLAQGLSAFVAYWLRGPLAALTLTAMLPSLILSGILLFKKSPLGPGDFPLVPDGWAVAILLPVSLALAVAGAVFRRGRRAKTFFLWLGLAGVTHAGLLALPQATVDGLMDPLLEAGGLIAGRSEAHAADANGAPGHGLAPLDEPRGPVERTGPAYAKRSMIWLLGMSVALLVLALSMLAQVAAWLVARLRSEQKARDGLDAACAVTSLSTGMWLVATSTAAAPLVINYADALDAREEILRSALMSTGVHWIGSLLLLLAALWTVVARQRWKSAVDVPRYDGTQPAPRLLLASGIRSVLIALAVVGPSIFLWQTFGFLGLPKLGLLDKLTEMNVTAVQFGSLIAAVTVYFAAHLSFGLDLGLDVISYFRRETAEPGGEPAFLLRKQIQDRLRTVLEVLAIREKPDRVTIVSHSQGTVIAIDVLANDDPDSRLAGQPRYDLVTMGSPFHHLYQHYFPTDYPRLDDSRWDLLRQRVDRWVNIFRCDDFIGTDIEPGGTWPENCAVEPGGHTGYWNDRQVLDILRDRHLV